tara:strand:+ start:14907 stop:15617 length:711 start_codon:yes stop_codon:yes gene_type:complete
MNKASKYSVIGTEYRIIKQNGEDLVEKSVISNIDLGLSQEQLLVFFEQYIKEIQGAGINLPEVKGYKVLDDRIMFLCENAGQNILEIFNLNELVRGKGRPFLELTIKEILKAIDGKINLDPHIKNFVIGPDGISYVDFSPPYTKEYIQKRIDKALMSEVTIVRENLDNFLPQNLLHHFLGDFFNVDRNISIELIREIYNLIDKLSPQVEDLDTFVTLSKRIRASEDERIRRNIFLY